MINKKTPKHLVMIVGMHRSGTSAVGRLLETIGFEFGNNLLEGIDSINDDGFWEDKEVVALNEHILELYDFSWFDFERMPGKWWEDAQIKELVGVAETWYYESFSGTSPIAVKDPRFCRLLPFWKRVFQGLDLELHILFVFRHPVEVAASLKKRDGFPMQLGYLLWLSYTIDALYYSRNLNLSLLHYEELLRSPGKVIDRLYHEDFSHIALNTELDKKSLIESSVDAGRHHQKIEMLATESLKQGDIQLLAIELFEELLTATADVAKGLADKYRKRLYRLLDHHKEILAALEEGIHHQVDSTQKLFQLGGDHTHALNVIREKDAQLEENKSFIGRCLEEIKNKELLLKSPENSHDKVDNNPVPQDYVRKFDDWMAGLSKLVDDYRMQISEQKQFIAECEEKLQAQTKGLADNQDYIARCHARLGEQDAGIAENRGYIAACEERIRVQDEGLVIRDHQLLEKNEKIVELEKSNIQTQEQLTRTNMELVEKTEKLQLLINQEQALKSRLDESAGYIAKCQARIAEQDAGIAENRGYIAACEERIRVQDEGMVMRDHQLLEKNEKNVELEKTVVQLQEQLTRVNDELSKSAEQIQLLISQEQVQKSHLEESAGYIAKCQARIAEQDAGIAENRGYIAACERRIHDQDEILAIKDRQIEENLRSIEQLEQLQFQLKDQLSMLNNQRDDLSSRIIRSDQLLAEQSLQIKTQQDCISDQTQHIHHLSEQIKLAELESARQSAITDRLNNLEKINRQRISLQKYQLEKLKAHAAALESELVALRAEHAEWGQMLERYRSYRTVKLIDKLFPETER